MHAKPASQGHNTNKGKLKGSTAAIQCKSNWRAQSIYIDSLTTIWLIKTSDSTPPWSNRLAVQKAMNKIMTITKQHTYHAWKIRCSQLHGAPQSESSVLLCREWLIQYSYTLLSWTCWYATSQLLTNHLSIKSRILDIPAFAYWWTPHTTKAPGNIYTTDTSSTTGTTKATCIWGTLGTKHHIQQKHQAPYAPQTPQAPQAPHRPEAR